MPSIKICKKCNSEITHNLKRRLCTKCLKDEGLENYHFKKEVYNEARKDKRLKLKEIKECVICKVEFQTAYKKKCTCSDDCSYEHRKNLSLAIYYRKDKR